jgi:hypothetical protein
MASRSDREGPPSWRPFFIDDAFLRWAAGLFNGLFTSKSLCAPWGRELFIVLPIVPSNPIGVNVMAKLNAIILLAAIMAPLPAIAYTQADADACTPDAMRLCQNAIPDANRVAQCLMANKQQLSPACTNVFNRPRGANVDRPQPMQAQPTKY